MNTAKLKAFAPKARRDLIRAVTDRAQKLGITPAGASPATIEGDSAIIEGKAYPRNVGEMRESLAERCERDGFEQVVEAAAYTWFNRLMALRYMEVHGYLDHGFAVLSDPEDPKNAEALPQILREAANVDLPGVDRERAVEMKLAGDKDAELYRLLLLGQCRALNHAMPFLFEPIDDDTELLLPENLLHSGSLVRGLVGEVEASDWENVEVVGWLYQFYISDRKDEVIGKVSDPADIPAATQLFTPEWIVRFLVENSLARLWVEATPGTAIQSKCPFLVSREYEEHARDSVELEAVTVLDPAAGSGHMLVAAYDVLREMYLEKGYRLRDVPSLILGKNLWGLDLDPRATQLCSFTLMMKGRADDRRFFDRQVLPQCFSISPADANGDDPVAVAALTDGAGSLARPTSDCTGGMALLRKKYDVVVTNPPYMGTRQQPKALKAFLGRQYGDGKADLFGAFILRCLELAKPDGFAALVTMQSWLFMSSFAALRERVLAESEVVCVAHLGARAFGEIAGEVVQTAAFILTPRHVTDHHPTFVRAVDGGEAEKEAILRSTDSRYSAMSQEDFLAMPEAVLTYWASELDRKVFASLPPLETIAKPRQGLSTSDDSRFLRLWHEVAFDRIGLGASSHEEAKASGRRWFPINKGGAYRRWWGNAEYVVDWENDGERVVGYAADLYGSPTRTIKNMKFYFRPGITWSRIAGLGPSFRKFPKGYLIADKGSGIYPDEGMDDWVTAVLNSRVAVHLLRAMSQNFGFEVGHVKRLPLAPHPEGGTEPAVELVRLHEAEWNENETAWGFERNPLLAQGASSAAEALDRRLRDADERVRRVVDLERQNDDVVMDAYGYRPDDIAAIKEAGLSISTSDDAREAQALVSFAIGCMMGRFSLDEPGIIYAGAANVGFEAGRYRLFAADDDGIVPLSDFPWFDDDAAMRFFHFVSAAWPRGDLQGDLERIANGLGSKKGEAPRDTIRRYLCTSFFKDHLQTYGKRPIYWLFSSGKERAFEALVYLHRYNEGTLARMRTEYVIPLQGKLNARIAHLTKEEAAAGSTAQARKAAKDRAKMEKKQVELAKFDEKLKHYADKRIALDLDDGVKVNYGKFSDLLAEVKKVTGKKPS